MATETLRTPITKLFGIKYPIMLAGMNVAAGPELAAEVTNAGGLGVIGGVGYTPNMLRMQIEELKEGLVDKNAPFGVDLLLPKVGAGARKTNKDYTGGKLPEMIDIIVKSGCKLFVSAVGVPPKWAVEKLHAAGIPCMNMIGAPKHVKYALEAGCDIICAQGGEGGGHTGSLATSILIPKVVDLCKGKVSQLTGEPIMVVAAGGIFDSRGLAMALCLGAQAVWVGTRFVVSKEAGAPPAHQKAVLDTGYNGTVRTLIYTGRPMRVGQTPYIMDWETNRQDEILEETSNGRLPAEKDFVRIREGDETFVEPEGGLMAMRPWLMGQCAGALSSVESAQDIIEEMMSGAIRILRGASGTIARL